MSTLLENLTKEDLIKVIATMHDTIQEWKNNGWGIPDEDANTLITVGRECVDHCSKTSWDLPIIK